MSLNNTVARDLHVTLQARRCWEYGRGWRRFWRRDDKLKVFAYLILYAIRKIEELPELWYVLIGNMSFVGPRLDVPEFAGDSRPAQGHRDDPRHRAGKEGEVFFGGDI